MIKRKKGITLIELVIVIAIISMVVLLSAPEIERFRANYNLRSCATDLIQNMRLARAMAIKENREYLITFDTGNQRYLMGFDGDGDNYLVSATDGFGTCVGAGCVRIVNLGECGNGIGFGTLAPNGPDDNGDGNNDPLCANGLGVCFGSTANPVRANFNANGSVDDTGYAYFQQATRGYSYVATISNTVGATNMWKWDGDKDNTGETDWTEIR